MCKLGFQIDIGEEDDLFWTRVQIIEMCDEIINHQSPILFRRNDFCFQKSSSFILDFDKCFLPYNIHSKNATQKLYFVSDQERKIFLLKFKNKLIEFSKSDVFTKKFLEDNLYRISYNDGFWFIY